MKAYRLIGYLLLVVLGLGFALPLLTWLSMPGDRLGAAPDIWFLLPAILLTILFFLLPKISRTRFNVAILCGGTLLVVCILAFSLSPISIVLYVFGVIGLFVGKRNQAIHLRYQILATFKEIKP